MTSFKFATLAPVAVAAKNAKVAAENEAALTGQVLGIEVTEPALAARCSLGNIDPQHTGGNAACAAIEETVTCALPTEGTRLVTLRADLDSVGGMAVLNTRAKGESLDPAKERIAMIATSDKFARGGYPGPKALPTKEKPWDESTASAESSRPLAAIAAAISDFKLPMADRVSMMERWLLTGDEPANYRANVERERADFIRALESGEIRHSVRNGRIAVVETTHRAATSVGYALAPVVIAANPKFVFQNGPEHLKYTICQYSDGFVNMKGVMAELGEREKGWGGSPTIGGSPQGVSSQLTVDEIVAVVEKHLL